MRSKKGKPAIGIIVGVLVVLIALVVTLTGFITDWMWFKEMGYVSVFFKELTTKIKLGLPTFVITTLLGVLFLAFLKRNFLRKNDFFVEEAQRLRVTLLMWALAVIFGCILTASVLSDQWFEILKFLNAQSFGSLDPLFSKDIGFYVFKLEFLEGLSNFILLFSLILLGLTIVFYVLLLGFADRKTVETVDGEEVVDGIIYRGPELGDLKSKVKALLGVASTEVIIIGIIFFLAVAVRFYLMQFDLLYGGTGVAYGAGYTDIKVSLTIYKIVQICSLISAICLVISIKTRKLLVGIIFPAITVLAIAVNGPLAGVVQNLVVSPDEINKESKYIGYNIQYTRDAYGLADIDVRDFEPKNTLTKIDVLDNMETFSNIRINDFEPAEQFYNQTQSIRSYYTFNDVDVDRYSVNDEYTQVFLSAREIDQSKVEDSWLIKHLKYTHGYGLTLSRVDKITSSGQPDMLIDSIPPVSEVPEIQITRPEIYYGESTDDYVIVNTDEEEFDYPSGEENVYCKYEGEGGIPLSFFNKVLFAIREGSMKLLVSGNINSDSKIMIYRDIMTRIQKIAPFLLYDDSAYLVVDDQGKLFWMIDAYTCSEYYPYSEPYSGESDINYIRNSVKITVDAYNGTTNFYIVDDSDPISLTLAKIYPDLFKSLDQMPQSLQGHLKYSNSLLKIQSSVYKKYHMTNEEVFYQNEDLWAIANEVYGQTEEELSPINFIMKLPGEEKAEFIASVPYTPDGKSNMTGILIARNDNENYGQLVLYRLPKDRIIYGPAQIEAQINQDAEISKEFSLWNNSGVRYSRGNLFVFPVEESLIYAEPIYMESSSSSLPEVKRVIMYYGDQVAYEPTLAECLDTLFGEGAGAPLLTPNPIEKGHELAANGGELTEEEKEAIQTPDDTDETPQIVEKLEDAIDREKVEELIKETESILNKLLEKFNDLQN